MLGHKKDRHMVFLGHKQDKHMIFSGNKQDANKNNGVTNINGNSAIEQHKTLSQYAPLGVIKK